MKKQLLNSNKMKLPISALRVDKYQKKVRKRVVDEIVNNFNPAAVGVIHVSQREDGSLWIFDGQHRTEALSRLGFEYVDCLVFSGLTPEQEASGFIGHHAVSKPTKIEEHIGKVFAKDKTALEIEKIVGELDLSVVAGGRKNTIQSVNALYHIYEKNGGEVLRRVLKIIKDGSPDSERPYNAQLMKALRDLIVKHNELFDDKWIIKKFNEINLNQLNNNADAFVSVYGFSKVDGMKMAITKSYNHRKSERLKLK